MTLRDVLRAMFRTPDKGKWVGVVWYVSETRPTVDFFDSEAAARRVIFASHRCTHLHRRPAEVMTYDAWLAHPDRPR